jgi:hypothetical protein
MSNQNYQSERYYMKTLATTTDLVEWILQQYFTQSDLCEVRWDVLAAKYPATHLCDVCGEPAGEKSLDFNESRYCYSCRENAVNGEGWHYCNGCLEPFPEDLMTYLEFSTCGAGFYCPICEEEVKLPPIQPGTWVESDESVRYGYDGGQIESRVSDDTDLVYVKWAKWGRNASEFIYSWDPLTDLRPCKKQ